MIESLSTLNLPSCHQGQPDFPLPIPTKRRVI
jgi:hypothetical protein